MTIISWNEEHNLVGKKVYTNRTVGKILAVSEDGKKYRVEQTDGKIRELTESSFSFEPRILDYSYGQIEGKRIADGRPSRGVNDKVSQALESDERFLEEIAAENGIDFSKYEKLNTGMKRMTIGNILRARFKKGETVTIYGEELK